MMMISALILVLIVIFEVSLVRTTAPRIMMMMPLARVCSILESLVIPPPSTTSLYTIYSERERLSPLLMSGLSNSQNTVHSSSLEGWKREREEEGFLSLSFLSLASQLEGGGEERVNEPDDEDNHF